MVRFNEQNFQMDLELNRLCKYAFRIHMSSTKGAEEIKSTRISPSILRKRIQGSMEQLRVLGPLTEKEMIEFEELKEKYKGKGKLPIRRVASVF